MRDGFAPERFAFRRNPRRAILGWASLLAGVAGVAGVAMAISLPLTGPLCMS